jgi:hypothetical protein
MVVCGDEGGFQIMCCEQTAWLVEHVAVPAIFVLFGALLGFVLGQIKDYFDSRRIKKSFLKAIRIELTTLRKHLEGTLKDVTEVLDGLRQKGARKALHLSPKFQVGVYTSQLARLRDVSDSVVLEIIRFYDQLSNLEIVKAQVAARSYELSALTGSSDDIERENPVTSDYVGSLEEVIRRIEQLIPAADGLIRKLPD